MVASLLLGTPNQGTTGAVPYTFPDALAYDILCLAVESNNTAGIVTGPATMAHAGSSPRAQGSNVTSISVFWERLVEDARAPVRTVPAQSDHQIGIPFIIRGAPVSGNFWEVVNNTSGQATGTTGRVVGGLTTVSANNRILYICSSSADQAADIFTNWGVGSGLSGWSILDQHHTANGNGGGLLVGSGTRAAAGVIGASSFDFSVTSAHSDLIYSIPEGPSPLWLPSGIR